jgi:chromosome segregation protein
VQEAQKELELLIGRRAVGVAEMRRLESEIEGFRSRYDLVDLRLREGREELDLAEKRIAHSRQALDEAEDAHQQSRREQADLEAKLDGLRSARGLELERIPKLHAALARAEGRLEELRVDVEGSRAIIKVVREAVEAGQVSGFLGRLLEQVRVEPGYERAVVAALGEFAAGLALQSPQDIEATLERLGTQRGGSAVLLPLETSSDTAPLPDPQVEGSLGTAAQFVQAPPAYAVILEHLLGRTLVAQDRSSARRIRSGLPHDARVVTLQGELLFPSGAVITGAAGSLQKKMAGESELEESLARAKLQLDEAHERKGRLSEEIAEAEAAREQASVKIDRASEAGQEARLDLAHEQQKATGIQKELQQFGSERVEIQEALQEAQDKLENLQEQEAELLEERQQSEGALQRALTRTEQAAPSLAMTRAEAQVEVAERAHADAQLRMEEFEARSSAISSDLQAWKRRLEGLQEEKAELPVQLGEVNDKLTLIEGQISALKENVEPAEKALREAEKKRSELEGQESELRSELRSVEQEHSQSQIILARRQEEMVGLRRRIEDDFGLIALEMDADVPGQAPLPLEGLVERLPHVETLPGDLEEQVNRLRAQLRRIGSVNLEAQREYDELSERVGFLTGQVDDLRRAETQIQEIIAELDLLMEREFRKTFDAVAVAFRKAFKRLFGGGSAHLVLSDPEDLTHTGIDIEARLPGRREQGLAMLSGGERSLTASALIFALLEVSPTPFCVLDEVDAMLDEANVLRFTEMLRELSQQTQFIVITHNRLTVQAAEVIYGVSMEADSISRVISLRLDEAERELAA